MEATLAQVIEDFITGFRRDPDAMTEVLDLRRVLYSSIYRHLKTLNLRFEIPQSELEINYNQEREIVRLTPVKTAYPAKEKFDIAVLDTTAKRPVANAEERYATYWQQPVALAIQLHFCPEDQDLEKYDRKLRADLKKFDSYAAENGSGFTGLSLLLTNDFVPGAEDRFPALSAGAQAWQVGPDGIRVFDAQPA